MGLLKIPTYLWFIYSIIIHSLGSLFQIKSMLSAKYRSRILMSWAALRWKSSENKTRIWFKSVQAKIELEKFFDFFLKLWGLNLERTTDLRMILRSVQNQNVNGGQGEHRRAKIASLNIRMFPFQHLPYWVDPYH